MDLQKEKQMQKRTGEFFFIISNKGKILYFTGNCMGILGYTQEELLNSCIFDYIHKDDLYLLEDMLFYKHELLPKSLRLFKKSGGYLRFNVSTDVINIEANEIIMKFTLAQHKQSEHSSGARIGFRDGSHQTPNDCTTHFIDRLPCPIMICIDGKIQYANSMMLHLLGAEKRDDIEGKMIYDFIDYDFHPVIHSRIHQLHKGNDGELLELSWNRMDKRKMEVELRTTLIDYNGLKAELFVISDVSSKRNVQYILKKSRERYQKLIHNSIDTIAVIHNNKWVFMNKSGMKLFEAPDYQDILGKSIFQFLPLQYHEELKWRLDEIVRGHSETVFMKQKWLTFTKKIIHTDMICIATTYFGEPAVQIILKDLSDRKQAEELMIRSEKLSLAGQLAAGIAHEIRNPLTAIKGFLQLLQGESEKGKKYFEIIFSELNRIEMILSELLMLAKPQEAALKKANVGIILHEVVTLLETEAILKNIVICKDIAEEAQELLCDQNQLKQVFINLIKNAIDAMPNGGTITISSKTEGDFIVMKVKDEGKGIPKEVLERIGEPFLTTKKNGTGLGLMITYKIIENHNGTIDVNSSEKGTVFTIKLPKKDISA